MGEYADVKRRKILNLLQWLETQSEFHVGNGGNHQWIIRHSSWKRPFPIPFKGGTVSKLIVKELMSRIVATGICTKEQFDKKIK